MSAQLRLFPLMKPLVERLGEDFFKSAPNEPGVYVMSGARERILYIGQSKDLRKRLAYYKNANPDRIPRRLIRLVHQVEAITWERCVSGTAARARELELLRLHRPKFNRADTGPEFFHYIEARSNDGRCEIQLRFDAPARPEEETAWRGPIRGRLVPMQGLAALQRLFSGAFRQIRRCEELPMLPKRVTRIELGMDSAWNDELNAYLEGKSVDLAARLVEAQHPEAEPALRQLQEFDLEALLAWARVLKEAS